MENTEQVNGNQNIQGSQVEQKEHNNGNFLAEPQVNIEDRRQSKVAEVNLAILKNAIIKQSEKDRKKKKKLKPNFFAHGKKFRFANKSLFLFDTENTFRKGIVWLQEWKYFDNFITICILCNTVILMFQDYRVRLDQEKYENNWRNEMVTISEIIFSAIFIAEFLIKIIGMGFIMEPGTYLRDGWNILDFAVVITSIIQLIPNIGLTNFSAIRTLRVLRPLRSINSVKGMKVLVTTLIDSLPDLGNVVIFLMFIMILFAILSLQLFSGVFENRCRMTKEPVNGVWEADLSITRLCTLGDDSSCPANRYCGSPYEKGLKFDDSELQFPEFNYGYTRFDNVFLAFFSIFQSLTTEGWTTITLLLTDTYTPVIVYLYFVFLILVGSFFVVNLILAVVNESFVANEQKMKEKISYEEDEKDNHTHKSADDQSVNEQDKRIGTDEVKQNQIAPLPLVDQNSVNGSPHGSSRSQRFFRREQTKTIKNMDNSQKSNKENEDSIANGSNGVKRKQDRDKTIIAFEIEAKKSNNNPESDEVQEQKKQSKFNLSLQESQEPEDPYKGLSGCTLLRKKVEIFIDEPIFIGLTTLFILANTITLALDKHPMEESYENGLEIANLIFTIVFALEMVIKIFGLGVRGYLRDSFNIFDGLIVILSLVEIILSNTGQDGVSGGGFAAISAFRSLRLFRIFKLARSWVNLRNLLKAMFQTLQQISNFAVLVFLFMTVASLLGMEFFAYKIRFDENDNRAENLSEGTSPRVNYDEFLNGIVAVFVLLTNEDWNQVLYTHLIGTDNWWPVVYFVVVVVIGNFILLNLFLAILIYNFAACSEETKKRMIEEAEELKKKKNKRKKDLNKVSAWTQKIKSIGQKIIKDSNQNSFIQQNGNNNGEEVNKSPRSQNPVDSPKSLRAEADNPHSQSAQVPYTNSPQLMNRFSKFSSNFAGDLNSPYNKKNQGNGNIDTKRTDLPGDHNFGPNILGKNFLRNKDGGSVHFKTPVLENAPSPVQSEQQKQSVYQGPYIQPQSKSMFVRQEQEKMQVKSFNFSDLDKSMVASKNIAQRAPLEGKALFILDTQNFLRKIMYNLCGHNYFEWSVIILIVFSSIMLVLDDPQMDPDSGFKQLLYYIDFVVTILFVIESLVKIQAFGLIINGPHSYLRSLANCLDFLIVIFSVVGLFDTNSGNLDKLKILRILRVLRPLRLISRNEGLKLAINSLILSIPSMFNLLLVCLIFFLLFGIFGVNYFKGTFFYCHTEGSVEYDLISTKTKCFDYGGDWVNKAFNFDNIIEAMITLFILSSTEGWVSMMWDGVDSKGVDENPEENYQQAWAIFYIMFILIGGFFIMNLFAGIVVDSFNSEKDKLAGITLLTSQQQEWITIQQRILDTQPEVQTIRVSTKEKKGFQQKIYQLVTHKYFDPFILICILMNTLVFMLVYHRQPDAMQEIIQILNYSFLVIFTVEAILKIISFGKLYFSDPWNNFDFVVVILTLVGVALELGNVINNIGSATSIIRTFRIARVLKLIKRAKSLRMMFATFIITLPALGNIGGLLFLVLFLYSVLGMNLYSFVKQSADGLTDKANFTGFFESFFTLFKCSTGESWNLVLADITRSKSPDNACNDIANYDDFQKYGLTGCGSSTGYFYLISFQIMFAMIVLNLFVAVILEGFEQTLKNEESHLKPLEMSDFIELWKQFDPQATGFIKVLDFRNLMEKLEPPLGFKNLQIKNTQKNIRIAHLHLPIYQLKVNNVVQKQPQFYNFYEVFETLAKDVMLQEFAFGDFLHDPDKPVIATQKIERVKLKQQKKIGRQYHLSEFNSADRIGADYIFRYLTKIRIKKGIQKQENGNEDIQKIHLDSNTNSNENQHQNQSQQSLNRQSRSIRGSKTNLQQQQSPLQSISHIKSQEKMEVVKNSFRENTKSAKHSRNPSQTQSIKSNITKTRTNIQ